MTAEPAGGQRLLILGAGRFAPEVADLAESDGRYQVVACIEGLDRARVGQTIAGLPILWDQEIADLAPSHRVVCAVGSSDRRPWIEQIAALGFEFATIRHASAQLSPRSGIGPGSIVSAGVVVAAGARLGQHVILNRGSLIGHDVVVGDYATVGPGANIGGSTVIGAGAFIGMGAVVVNGLEIGADATIGAGALVTRDVPARTQVFAARARVITGGGQPSV